MDITNVKIDKTAFSVFTSFDEADEADRTHWRNASFADRLLALELMRQSAYGYNDPATRRLQRVLEIVLHNGGQVPAHRARTLLSVLPVPPAKKIFEK